VTTITDEEFSSCTKAQQEYITMRRERLAEQGSCDQEERGN
jgi:hypothetical protein